jgi:threonine dehydratase
MTTHGTVSPASTSEVTGLATEPIGSAVPAVTIDDVIAARERIAPYVHRTPLLGSTTLSRMTNTQLFLKAETMQRTGSFKSRGAVNALLQLTPEQKSRGVVTMSAGNHGQGLAYAAAIVGVRCVVFMPETAIPTKVEAIKGYGAEARFAPTMSQVFETMDAYREQQGLHFVHPFGDPMIVAGQGTVAMEILEDQPDLEAIVVPVGGGGLLAGIALTIKARRPEVRVVGVEPEGAAVVSRSLASGKVLTLDAINSVADGLSAPFAMPITQDLIRANVDDIVVLSDDEIVNALRLILERSKLLVEPAGAAATAALLSGKAGVDHGTRTVSILSGGNVDFGTLKRLL